MIFGPQNEPIPETEQESCLTTAELRAEKHHKKHHKSLLKDALEFFDDPDDNDDPDDDDPDDADDRDVAVDGPGFGPTKVPTSAVASGTDRDKAMSEYAAQIVVGPQGEVVLPTCESGICPLCGQGFPETCSDGGQAADPESMLRKDDYIDEIDEPEDDEAFEGASPSEFELLS